MSFAFRESYILPACGDAEPLRSLLLSCGHEKAVGEYRWSGLKRGPRELVIWQYTLKGRGCIRVDGVEYDLPPGMCFLARAPEDNCYYLPSKQPFWEFIYLTLGGAELFRLAGELRRRRGPVFRLPEDSRVVAAAWSIIEAARRNELQEPHAVSALAYDFMMRLFRPDSVEADVPDEDKMLVRIRNYCLNHIAETLDVDALARVAGYSRWHFSRLFRRVSGRSPSRFVTELRMEYALRLLQTSGDPLKVVGERCGYADTGHFCRVFRSVCGITPDSFRRGESPKRMF